MKNLPYLVLLFVFACQPSKADEINQVKKEAIELHDEVMPKMDYLKRVKKRLMLQADSLVKSDTLSAELLMEISDEIAGVNQSMMDWMNNFEIEFEGTEEAKLNYFIKQKTSIEEVKNAINESLRDGEKSLIDLFKGKALELHDEVMPKMGDLRKARKELMVQADSLVDSDSLKAQMLMEISDEIASANESMMNWMRNYEPDFEGSDEEKLAYFKKQKASIEEVKKAMNATLAKGKEALK